MVEASKEDGTRRSSPGGAMLLCFLFTSQQTLVHHLRIFVTSLNSIEDTQVVDGVECGCVIRSPCLLITSQRTLVHHLRIFETSLSFVKSTQVVDGVEFGFVIMATCLLFTNQSTLRYNLCIFFTASII